MYYLYYDAHGNQVATADSDGDTVSTESSDPWGVPGSALPSDQTTHAYVGADDKQTDSTTGLILMGARPYDATTGRFLSVDPIDGGSINNYDYADQDPVNGYDLTGTTGDPGMVGRYCVGLTGGALQSCAYQNWNYTAYCSQWSCPKSTGGGFGSWSSILRFAAKYSGACLSGASIGTISGPEGSVVGCILAVGITSLKSSSNPTVRKIGTVGDEVNDLAGFLTARDILLHPDKAEKLIAAWKEILSHQK